LLPDDPRPAGHIGIFAKKRAPLADSIMTLRKNQAPPSAEPDFAQGYVDRGAQRPKNNHNRRITGIGTPSSQSRIPRPMIASLISSIERKTQKGNRGSGNRSRKNLTSVRCSTLAAAAIGGRHLRFGISDSDWTISEKREAMRR
jgi:hypothetical protein